MPFVDFEGALYLISKPYLCGSIKFNMNPSQHLAPLVDQALQNLFSLKSVSLEFQATRRDFEGDVTLVIFPLVKLLKSSPAEIGTRIGDYLRANGGMVDSYNVVSGFLNIVVSGNYYLDFFNSVKSADNFGISTPTPGSPAILVEYSSPNTNKPLHLGHVRNNLLGYSVARILEAAGNRVYKTQIVNDRGIHICKSMIAWQEFGKGETPASTGLKGDKLVGNYYVAFDQAYREQVRELIQQGMPEEQAKKIAPLMQKAQLMLQQWEQGDPQVLELWEKMNGWVYDGFGQTYKNLGVDFDKIYYESQTYLLGKDVVQMGLEKGVFERDPDGSVWIDLTAEGLDRKIVLRSDGTAVYMTQDIGTAIQRVQDFPGIAGMVYTVGNEQDYHFKVLFLILQKLGFEWAENLYHLSYGMVDLPSGKMKSREGTVVDADDLIDEMVETAERISAELGKLEGYPDQDKKRLYNIIGLGALKYYILKVDPKKRILFNPEESVDFAGNTGPFIQYTYARIQSILRRAETLPDNDANPAGLHPKEKELLKFLAQFPETIQQAASAHSPAIIANYTYELVKEYNSFYQSVPILAEENAQNRDFRIQLSHKVGQVIASAFSLLGIGVPERM